MAIGPFCHMRRLRKALGTIHFGIALAFVLIGCLLSGASPVGAQLTDPGVVYLIGTQISDGSWQSPQVRSVLATTEALRVLQAFGAGPYSRPEAVVFLQRAPVEDSDDRARRIAVLAAEGKNVSALLAQLRSDADPAGGWGLTASFVADSFDTSLALAAVAPQATVGNDVLLPALSMLAGAQRDDGGWACADSAMTGFPPARPASRWASARERWRAAPSARWSPRDARCLQLVGTTSGTSLSRSAMGPTSPARPARPRASRPALSAAPPTAGASTPAVATRRPRAATVR